MIIYSSRGTLVDIVSPRLTGAGVDMFNARVSAAWGRPGFEEFGWSWAGLDVH